MEDIDQLYKSNLDYRMGPIVKKILEEHFNHISSWDAVKMCAALHFYCYHKLDYHTRDDYDGPGRRPFRSPTETWKRGGNCEEQSILVASLLNMVKGTETKVLSVVTGDRSAAHLVPMVGFYLGGSKVYDKLESFYREDFHFRYNLRNGVHWTVDGDLSWFSSDSEFSVFLGDTESLADSGYVRDTGSGWNWIDVRRETHL